MADAPRPARSQRRARKIYLEAANRDRHASQMDRSGARRFLEPPKRQRLHPGLHLVRTPQCDGVKSYRTARARSPRRHDAHLSAPIARNRRGIGEPVHRAGCSCGPRASTDPSTDAKSLETVLSVTAGAVRRARHQLASARVVGVDSVGRCLASRCLL